MQNLKALPDIKRVGKVPEKRWGMHDQRKSRADKVVSQSVSSLKPTRALSSLELTCQRANMVSKELLTKFLPGKQLLIGLANPYEFVAVQEAGSFGLQISTCMCPDHNGAEGLHFLKTSEVTLVIEGGADRVWVFISIPSRLREQYAWLPTVALDPCVDAEVCGVLVANPV